MPQMKIGAHPGFRRAPRLGDGGHERSTMAPAAGDRRLRAHAGSRGSLDWLACTLQTPRRIASGIGRAQVQTRVWPGPRDPLASREGLPKPLDPGIVRPWRALDIAEPRERFPAPGIVRRRWPVELDRATQSPRSSVRFAEFKQREHIAWI